MAGSTGKVRMVERSEFTSVEEADLDRVPGQVDIPDVAGLDAGLAERIVSRPPAGYRQIYNIYWDPNEQEMVIEFSATDAA